MSREAAIKATRAAYEASDDAADAAANLFRVVEVAGFDEAVGHVFDDAHQARAIFYADEVGDLQASEAELVSKPLRDQLSARTTALAAELASKPLKAQLSARTTALAHAENTITHLQDENERLRADNEQLGTALDHLIVAVDNLTAALKRGL